MVLKRLFLGVSAELAVDGLEKVVFMWITVTDLEMVESVLFFGDGPVMVYLLFNCCCAGR